MQILIALGVLLASAQYVSAGLPDKVYGVNIDGWYVHCVLASRRNNDIWLMV